MSHLPSGAAALSRVSSEGKGSRHGDSPEDASSRGSEAQLAGEHQAGRCSFDARTRLPDPCPSDLLPPAWEARLILGFLILGVLARCVRYFLRFPIWEDEAFLCVNLLDRSFDDLHRPLVYGQVAPLLFLVAQWSAVKLAGFHELSLRSVSFISGLASLFLFADLAGRLLRGAPRVLAIGIFAVAYPCIRYSAEAKPYGSDLLVALVLLWLALRYWQGRSVRAGSGASATLDGAANLAAPGSSWPLWALVAAAPLAIGLSFPAAFVYAGLSLTLLYVLWSENRPQWLAWGGMNAAVAVSGAGYYWFSIREQMRAQLDFMQGCWDAAFVPWREPAQLPLWLLKTHASDLTAYPIGGPNGASALTLLAVVAGVAIAWRAKRRGLLLLLLGPLGVTFLAAAARLYPYGGHVRLNIYMAPAFCLLAGLGGAWLLTWLPPLASLAFQKPRPRRLLAALGVLLLIGAGSMLRDIRQPYKTRGDFEARAFAQWFWPNADQDGAAACTITDLHRPFAPDLYHCLNWTAEYLCNQRIYSPRLARGELIRWDEISAERPLRCVVYRDSLTSFDPALRDRWLQEMQQRYELIGDETLPLVRMDKHERYVVARDYLEIYKFIPRSSAAAGDSPLPPRVAAAGSGETR